MIGIITIIFITISLAYFFLRNMMTFNKMGEATDFVYKYKHWQIYNDTENLSITESFDEYIVTYNSYLFNMFYFGTAIKEEYVDLIVNKQYLEKI